MTMGFFTPLAGNGAVAWSGGSKPNGAIYPAVIAVMAERGIDLTNEYPKPWGYEILQATDVIITMGCGDYPGPYPAAGTKTGSWTTRTAKMCRLCGPSATKLKPVYAG
jgi:protein-tyrosine-phosphatase